MVWLRDCGHREGRRHQSPSPHPRLQAVCSPFDETRRCPRPQPVSTATCALSARVTQRINAHLIFTINYASHNFSIMGRGRRPAPWEGWSGPLGHSRWGSAESSLLPLAGWWLRGHGRWPSGCIAHSANGRCSPRPRKGVGRRQRAQVCVPLERGRRGY